MKTVTASEDWLSYALSEYDEEKLAAAGRRAEAALKVRLDTRVSKFLKRAENMDELGARLDTVDEAVKEIVDEVATEYGADPAGLFEAAARKIAFDFNVPFQQPQQGTPDHGYTEVQCAKCGTKAALGQPCPMCGHVNQPGEEPGSPGGGNAGGMGGLRDRIMGSTKQAIDLSRPPHEQGDPSHEHGMGADDYNALTGADEPAAGEVSCPNCGSGRIAPAGYSLGGQTAVCHDCGHYFDPTQDLGGPHLDAERFGNPAPGRFGEAKVGAGPELPEGAHYDYKRVNPETPIGGDESVAGARGPSYEYNRDVEDTLGQSEAYPREHQDIGQYVEDRRTINDTTDKDVIKRKVDHIDADKPIGAEQKGVGGTFPRGDQAKAVAAVTSKFHILD